MKKLLIIFFVLNCGFSLAQQQVMFTQYMFNGLALNPAYAGIHDGLSASILWREQWVGFEGAPSTQTIAVHGPVKHSPASLGGMIIRDKIGVTEQIGVYMSGAYRIYFNNDSKLSFGLQGSLVNFRAEFVDSSTGLDPVLLNGNINEFKPNFGTGILYHSEKFYIGFSVPQILKQNFDNSNELSDARLNRHYFLSGGIVFELNPDFKLKPNVLAKYVEGAPIQLDLNLNLLIKDIVWVGVSYRSFESVDLLTQIQITPRLQLGYSYDIPISSELSNVNSGSHEVMLSYVFKLTKTHAISPRYF
ncbi:MAG: type IX secretion system membrane protein PorP/SprF [Reichenbachiella sp.]